MGAPGFDRFTLTQVNELLGDLEKRPLGPDDPQVGDVVFYTDGSWAVVGTSSQVSYGPREQMQAVARLFPREGEAAGEEASKDKPAGGLKGRGDAVR